MENDAYRGIAPGEHSEQKTEMRTQPVYVWSALFL